MKLREGNVFTGVSLFTGGGGVSQNVLMWWKGEVVKEGVAKGVYTPIIQSVTVRIILEWILVSPAKANEIVILSNDYFNKRLTLCFPYDPFTPNISENDRNYKEQLWMWIEPLELSLN